mmetsp:Transcript_23293/g.64777  ORF Transcript_23293/g.64777 Transcript_23293/m.64777 type:complete len:238 (-) Transcript_23293:65-778(-)
MAHFKACEMTRPSTMRLSLRASWHVPPNPCCVQSCTVKKEAMWCKESRGRDKILSSGSSWNVCFELLWMVRLERSFRVVESSSFLARGSPSSLLSGSMNATFFGSVLTSSMDGLTSFVLGSDSNKGSDSSVFSSAFNSESIGLIVVVVGSNGRRSSSSSSSASIGGATGASSVRAESMAYRFFSNATPSFRFGQTNLTGPLFLSKICWSSNTPISPCSLKKSRNKAPMGLLFETISL